MDRGDGTADVPEGSGAGAEPVILVFDRRTHPDPADRARAWQAATSVSMETTFEPEDLEGFTGHVTVLPLGPFLLADMALSTATVLRPRSTRVRWEHDHIILDLIVTGRLDGSVGAKPVSLGAGDCLVVDLRSGMRLRLEDVRYIGLIMPRGLVVDRVGTAALDGLVCRAETAEGKVLGSLLSSLAAEARRLAPGVALALAQAALDVLAACAAPREARRTEEQEHARRPTVAQMRRFIDHHAARPDFGPEALCAGFGLSRAALYRLFAPAGGVAEAIRRRRAALAVGLLARPDATPARIADIARASGFGSERSLRNALQDLYAASPRDLLRHGGAVPVGAEAPDPAIGRLFDGL